MVSRALSLVLTSIVAAPLVMAPALASAGETSPRDVDETRDGENKPVLAGHERARTGWVWVDPVKDLAPDAVASNHISHIIYVNRCAGGCTITPGTNDARANTSSIASSSSVLSEFQWSDEVFNETIDCIKDVYSPYDVEIVTEDPGTDVFHHEAILAGSPQQLGLDGNIGGIAPSSCSPLNNVISFSFANGPSSGNGDPLNMCWTVAQESAHAFGLPNHVFNCLDPMTYLDGCGKKYFRNQSFQCGEFSPGPCNCSGASQNSHVELRTVFGDGTAPAPPELSILLPKADEAVDNGFSIYWDSQDPRLVARNEVWINGTKYAEVPGHAYEQRFDEYNAVAPELPDGVINLEIKSYNELGSEAVASLTVTKGSPCSGADSCFEFQQCTEGRCEYPPATAQLGDECDGDFHCAEGVCGQVGSSRACTVTCNPTITGSCAEGFECKDGSSGFVCWPEGEDGGCCSVSGTRSEPLPWFGAGLFFLGLMLLRRKRVP